MEEKEIFKAETSTELELPMYEGLQAGFPQSQLYHTLE